MTYQSKAAQKETDLEKAQRKTAQSKAYFGTLRVGDRVEVTTHRGAKQGQICLVHAKYITVIFDGKQYKTTLSRADYLTGRYQIKKLEEVSQVVQKREIPSKAELEAKLEEHKGSINKIAKDYNVSWGLARDWLNIYGLMGISRELTNKRAFSENIEEDEPDMVKNEVYIYPEPVEDQEQETVEQEAQAKPAEPAKQDELVEEIDLSDALNILYDSQERVEYVLGLVLQKLDALEQKVDQLQNPAQVEFKDVADLALKMHQVWIDARRD